MADDHNSVCRPIDSSSDTKVIHFSDISITCIGPNYHKIRHKVSVAITATKPTPVSFTVHACGGN